MYLRSNWKTVFTPPKLDKIWMKVQKKMKGTRSGEKYCIMLASRHVICHEWLSSGLNKCHLSELSFNTYSLQTSFQLSLVLHPNREVKWRNDSFSWVSNCFLPALLYNPALIVYNLGGGRKIWDSAPNLCGYRKPLFFFG